MRKSAELSSQRVITQVGTPGAAVLTGGAYVSTFGEMPKLIQLRNVPDELHRQLKERAAREGLSLSEFLIREAQKIVGRVGLPTVAEVLARLERRSKVNPKPSPAEVIRRQRGR